MSDSDRCPKCEELREESIGWQECLIMVAEECERLGCCHDGKSHDSTPPMMYPEWVRCVVAKRERTILTLTAEVKRLESESAHLRTIPQLVAIAEAAERLQNVRRKYAGAYRNQVVHDEIEAAELELNLLLAAWRGVTTKDTKEDGDG